MLYEACKTTIPERFNFEVINRIFQTWVDFGNKGTSSEVKRLLSTNDQVTFYVPYDNIDWITEAFTEKVVRGEVEFMETHLKFANNGFLYSQPAEFKSIRQDIKRYHNFMTLKINLNNRHGSESWILLEKSEYETSLRSIMDWASDFFADGVLLNHNSSTAPNLKGLT